MKKFVIIFYFFYGNFLVSGVPLSQLIQAQTCPYNQNGYQDLNTLLQQALPQLYQQPSNNNHYPQQIMVQNDMLVQTQPYNQINPRTNQLSQMYMDRILSSPTVQGILDSSSRYYSPVLVDTPNPKSMQSPGTVPQVVNNYFILPPELLNIDEELSAPRKIDKRKQTKQNRKRRPNKDVTDNIGIENVKRENTNQNNGQGQRRGNTKPQNNNNKERSQEENNRRTHRRRPNERSDNNNNRQMRERNGERRPKPRREQGNDNSHKPARKERQKEINTQAESKQANDEENIPQVTNNREPIHENEQSNRERKKQSKLQSDDDFIEDFRKNYPGIPDEAITSLLSYLKSSQLDQHFDYSQLYNQDLSYPLRFDHLIPPNNRQPNQNPNQKSINQRRPDRPPQNNQRQRRPEPRPRPNQKPRPKPVLVTPNNTTPVPSTIDSSATKSKLITSLKPQETKPEIPVETTTYALIAPELGTEDELPEVHNGIVDDYYPDFTNDHAYLDSEEIHFIRNHRDNRYHYTTDRNEGNTRNIDVGIKNVIMKPMNDEEMEILEFRTPPLLESPDFRTKQIKKSNPKSNEHKSYNKSSNYSEAKSTKDVKNHKIDKIKKTEPDIETVYAHSKVIKYGKNYDTEEEIDTPVVTYYLPDNMQYEKDGKTVIVAKPIPADYFW